MLQLKLAHGKVAGVSGGASADASCGATGSAGSLARGPGAEMTLSSAVSAWICAAASGLSESLKVVVPGAFCGEVALLRQLSSFRCLWLTSFCFSLIEYLCVQWDKICLCQVRTTLSLWTHKTSLEFFGGVSNCQRCCASAGHAAASSDGCAIGLILPSSNALVASPDTDMGCPIISNALRLILSH